MGKVTLKRHFAHEFDLQSEWTIATKPHIQKSKRELPATHPRNTTMYITVFYTTTFGDNSTFPIFWTSG